MTDAGKDLKKEQQKIVSETVRELAKDLRTNLYVSGQAQFTDMTNRDFFLKAYGEAIRYCKPWDKFLVWNGTNWEMDDDGRVEEYVVEFIRKMYRATRYIKDPQLAVEFERHLIKSESFRRIQAVIGLCKMAKEIKVRGSDLDTNPYLINTRNYAIDLKKITPRELDRKDMATKCSSFIFDVGARCPTWDRFVFQIFNGDVDLIRFIQKAMGYALTGDVSEQCLFILWGSGANGKSTFLNTIQNLMGDYACSTGTETFMRKSGEMSNDIARLRGMRLVTTSEAEQGKPLSESLIKQITGEDRLTARFLYGEYFSFVPTFKIFMATNHKPKIRGGDYGIWRRIKLIPFTVTIPPAERDRHLSEKLMRENSGIFNWLLDGYVMWQKEGLRDPDSVIRATEDYRDDMDAVGSFIKERCDVDAGGKYRVQSRTLYDAYVSWCANCNERVCSQKYLSLRLQEKGFRKINSNGWRGWGGIKLKADV